MNKLKTTLSVITGLTLITATIYAFNNINLVDKLNEQKITYQIEQKSLEKDNSIYREQRDQIEQKIKNNSNKWNLLQGKILQIDETIKIIETSDLDK